MLRKDIDLPQGSLEVIRSYAVCAPAEHNEAPVHCKIPTQNERDASHTLTACQPNLNGPTLISFGDDGY